MLQILALPFVPAKGVLRKLLGEGLKAQHLPHLTCWFYAPLSPFRGVLRHPTSMPQAVKGFGHLTSLPLETRGVGAPNLHASGNEGGWGAWPHSSNSEGGWGIQPPSIEQLRGSGILSCTPWASSEGDQLSRLARRGLVARGVGICECGNVW